MVELFACKEFPETGLHLVFQDALCPFAFICKNEIHTTTGKEYILYVLTVSGVAYCLKLRSPFTYVSGSNFPRNELLEFDMENPTIGKITAVAATSGCLVTGRQDGSIGCFRLGLDLHAPDFSTELRDDVGLGRLWNIMSRAKIVGAVQDMVISQVCGRKLLFALHLDGYLRGWDLASNTRFFNHNITLRDVTGVKPSRLWVAASSYPTKSICLAVLYGGASVSDKVAVYNFDCSVGEKIILSSEPSMQIINLEEERLVDLKITCSKLWLLKEDGMMVFSLSQTDCKLEHAFTYALQEDFLADLFFQNAEHTSDDLIWSDSSLFSLLKDQIANFVSSIFLRRLLQPGVHQNAALRAIIADHKKYISDHEFQSLTVAVVKKEILTIIEGEGVAANSGSILCYWKIFCTHFFRYWCQNNNPYGLFIDSSNDVIGLIRKNSVSLFRSLEGFEQLICNSDSSEEIHDLKSSGLIFPDNEIDCDLLFEVLRCMTSISQQLGRTASAIFYESLINPIISSDDVLCHLLKILETGYSSSPATSLIPHLETDTTWERRQATHKSQRKFSVYMLLSLHALRARTTSWTKVLDVIAEYLDFLKPKKCSLKYDFKGIFNINSSLLVLATSQIARVMFESSFDLLLLLGYLINVSGQVDMMQTDVARIKLELIPMIQETLSQWLILHYLGTTPTSPPTIDDFSSRLSSLHIGNISDKRSFDEKLGSSDFTLACLVDFPGAFGGQNFFSSSSFPVPSDFIQAVHMLCSSIIWGRTCEESPFSCRPRIELASRLLHHGQYEAAENLFLIIDTYSSQRKVNLSVPNIDVDWCARFHLLGFCLLLRAQNELHGTLKEQKVHEAVRCFFSAASGEGASQSLQNLSCETGFVYSGPSGSEAEWKFQYYQWAMQIFEQYGFSDGACQFALAALEQADEITSLENGSDDGDLLCEPASTIHGRLWANVFKYSIDQKHYRDAYCAIISNPDEDSKFICLRRFIIVLCELGAAKILCDGTLPFVGLMEKVEQELVWKAERSDISAKPNLYKLLYAFEAHRNNWRKAASYMYRYSVRLRKEVASVDSRQLSLALQEIILGLSTAINSLQLVDHMHSWIDPQHENGYVNDQGSPNKKARNGQAENSAYTVDPKSWKANFHVDVETLEKEYLLTSAQYLLTLVNDKFKFSGNQSLAYLVDFLIQENIYDMAFTVMLKFWKGSGLKRELERAFVAISHKCCSGRTSSLFSGGSVRTSHLLLPSTEDETYANGTTRGSSQMDHSSGNGQWETLELYLEKYKGLHPRLPATVAETLLHTDPQIELPLWLVHMFKYGRKAASWGMTGQESDPATLFRLYVDYGRHAEATNLLLEYLESFASLRPSDVINRKKMSAICFPYTAIERLWCQLEEFKNTGQMIDQCDRLQMLLRGALSKHLNLVKVDSEDAVSLGLRQPTEDPSS